MKTQELRESLALSSDAAKHWFLVKSTVKSKADWAKRNSLEDSGVGAVYAFFDKSEKCLYVGQTTQTLKQRAVVKTSHHYSASWWKKWKTLRFVNIQDQTEQITLELLLILSLAPKDNSKPGARKISVMFPA